MAGKLDIDKIRRKVKDALPRGAVLIGPTRAEWDAAGNCLSPVSFDEHAWPTRMPGFSYLHGQPGFEWFDDRNPNVVVPRMTEGRRGKSHGLSLTMHVPCRRCENCLKRRAAHWRLRMLNEYATSFRTWFGTVTLAPEMQYLAIAEAQATCHATAVNWFELSEEEQFAKSVAVIYRELQRYFKRVRKASRSTLRYVCVAERHKNGWPHFHVLVHEKRYDVPVRKQLLEAQWHWGFTKWKLVADKRQVSYVAKYLSKSLLVRVRASQAYGSVTSYDTADKNMVGVNPLTPPSNNRVDSIPEVAHHGNAKGGLINGSGVSGCVSQREQGSDGLSKAADLANGEPDTAATAAGERFALKVREHWPTAERGTEQNIPPIRRKSF